MKNISWLGAIVAVAIKFSQIQLQPVSTLGKSFKAQHKHYPACDCERAPGENSEQPRLKYLSDR